MRLWVNPENKPQYQVSDISHVAQLGKRIKAASFRFLLDLHYSDSWADPGQQRKPAVWRDLPFPELEQQVRSYSREVVAHLVENKAAPDMVQIGNEVKTVCSLAAVCTTPARKRAAVFGKISKADSSARYV